MPRRVRQSSIGFWNADARVDTAANLDSAGDEGLVLRRHLQLIRFRMSLAATTQSHDEQVSSLRSQ